MASRPVTIQAFDNINREVDLYNIDNYQLTGGTGGRTQPNGVYRRLSQPPPAG